MRLRLRSGTPAELSGATRYKGNLLEIGVWKGKSAGLLAMHCAPEEACVLVDPLQVAEAREHISVWRPKPGAIFSSTNHSSFTGTRFSTKPSGSFVGFTSMASIAAYRGLAGGSAASTGNACRQVSGRTGISCTVIAKRSMHWRTSWSRLPPMVYLLVARKLQVSIEYPTL